MPAEPQTPGSIPASAAPAVPTPTPIENNRTIEIDRFIPRSQVDARYLDTPYYVTPRDQVGEEALQLSGTRCAPRMWWGWGALSSPDGRGPSL